VLEKKLAPALMLEAPPVLPTLLAVLGGPLVMYGTLLLL
jgi:hypothetical protein